MESSRGGSLYFSGNILLTEYGESRLPGSAWPSPPTSAGVADEHHDNGADPDSGVSEQRFQPEDGQGGGRDGQGDGARVGWVGPAQ